MFDRWSTGLPCTCSGDRYAATPDALSFSGLAIGKLITFTSPVGEIRMFLGDTSRWTMPAFWASSSAWPIWATIALAWPRRHQAVAHQPIQRLALEQLHRHVQAFVRGPSAVDHAGDARALHPHQLLQLAFGPGQRRRVGQHVRVDDLVGHLGAGLAVRGPVHLTGAATTQARAQLEATLAVIRRLDAARAWCDVAGGAAATICSRRGPFGVAQLSWGQKLASSG